MFNNGSLVFSDSNYKIIFVDSNFNPIDKESKIFCKLYSSSYSDCRNRFMNSKDDYYKRAVGNGLYIVFSVLTSSMLIDKYSLYKFIVNEVHSRNKSDVTISVLIGKDLKYSTNILNGILGDNVSYYSKTFA